MRRAAAARGHGHDRHDHPGGREDATAERLILVLQCLTFFENNAGRIAK